MIIAATFAVVACIAQRCGFSAPTRIIRTPSVLPHTRHFRALAVAGAAVRARAATGRDRTSSGAEGATGRASDVSGSTRNSASTTGPLEPPTKRFEEAIGHDLYLK